MCVGLGNFEQQALHFNYTAFYVCKMCVYKLLSISKAQNIFIYQDKYLISHAVAFWI